MPRDHAPTVRALALAIDRPGPLAEVLLGGLTPTGSRKPADKVAIDPAQVGLADLADLPDHQAALLARNTRCPATQTAALADARPQVAISARANPRVALDLRLADATVDATLDLQRLGAHLHAQPARTGELLAAAAALNRPAVGRLTLAGPLGHTLDGIDVATLHATVDWWDHRWATLVGDRLVTGGGTPELFEDLVTATLDGGPSAAAALQWYFPERDGRPAGRDAAACTPVLTALHRDPDPCRWLRLPASQLRAIALTLLIDGTVACHPVALGTALMGVTPPVVPARPGRQAIQAVVAHLDHPDVLQVVRHMELTAHLPDHPDLHADLVTALPIGRLSAGLAWTPRSPSTDPQVVDACRRRIRAAVDDVTAARRSGTWLSATITGCRHHAHIDLGWLASQIRPLLADHPDLARVWLETAGRVGDLHDVPADVCRWLAGPLAAAGPTTSAGRPRHAWLDLADRYPADQPPPWADDAVHRLPAADAVWHNPAMARVAARWLSAAVTSRAQADLLVHLLGRSTTSTWPQLVRAAAAVGTAGRAA